jgi:glycerol-3-phosphate dehydrogenase
MWSQSWRDEVWSRLDTSWDIVIVGGGITGAGILAEAARAGLKALLVEAQDFASGTSSRSTKLVHGGLRYLRQGKIGLTRESVRERERLVSEASGLVTPLGFWLTSFDGDRMPGWMFGLGLAMYDALAGKWAHEKHGAEAIVARVPPLAGASLRGGYHYFDAQTDDARLVLRVMRDAVLRGGTAINYARARSTLRTADGRVRGIVLDDVSGGPSRSKEVIASVVVNATGAWADELRATVGATKKLRAIRGSHLIFPSSRLPLAQAISLLHPEDGRAVFAIPWEGVTIVGTTDCDHDVNLWTEPRITEAEIDYTLASVQHAFPTLEITRADVRATWSGVRGVVDTGARDPSKESREHALWTEEGLLTVAGGKLTTFRIMALEALRAARRHLPRAAERAGRGRILEASPEPEALRNLDPLLAGRLAGRHGASAAAIAALPEGVARIDGTPVLWSELRWAARDEGVVHLDDLLLRRARLGLLAEGGGLAQMDRIRAIAQPELGWDDVRWAEEEKRYRQIWRNNYAISP